MKYAEGEKVWELRKDAKIAIIKRIYRLPRGDDLDDFCFGTNERL